MKWFNPLTMKTAHGSLVEETLTLIGLSESPSYFEEPFAFVFLDIQPVNIEKVQKALLNFPQVLFATRS